MIVTEQANTSSDEDEEEEEESTLYSNHYKLVGIVVHSGQANGGHYYSFIQNKSMCDDEESDADFNPNTENENNW